MMNKKEPVLFQVSVLASLQHAVTRGTATVRELLAHGDTGFGTLEFPGGEMVVLDGAAYVGRCREAVFQAESGATSPFAFVTAFDPAFQIPLADCADLAAVTEGLDREIRERCGGLNHFYMVKIPAVFPHITLRTGTRVRTATGTESQREFIEYRELKGTVVALRCPAYAAQMNQPGWHLHFLSDDRQQCGHVTELSLSAAQCGIMLISRWEISLPQHEEFSEIRF